MERVKLFKSIESELWTLEDEINDWIKQSGARIINITGNIAPQSAGTKTVSSGSFSASDVLIIVLYDADE